MGSPAGKVGDPHICPMVNPGPAAVPHVGMPIAGPGAPSVLIEGMPAAIQGDQCPCAGPPDAIVAGSGGVLFEGMPAARMGDPTAHGGQVAMGSFTILIGEGGGGGGGGASGESQEAEDIEPPPEQDQLEIELNDEDGNPVAFAEYKVVLPDGSEKEGYLNAFGQATLSGIEPGDCQVSFPEIDQTEWDPEE